MSSSDDRPTVRTGHEPGRLRVSMAFSPDAHRDLCHAQTILSEMAGVGFSKSVVARVGVETLRRMLDDANQTNNVEAQRVFRRMAISHSSGRRIPDSRR